MSNPAAFQINIPRVNGKWEAGIAVGVDPKLLQEWKLPILKKVDAPTAAGYAAAWAWRMGERFAPECRNLLTQMAAAVIMTGMCRAFHIGNRTVIDGDFIQVEAMDPQVVEAVPAGILTRDTLVAALSMIIATKANWFQTNHHTGGTIATGYTAKVMKVVYNLTPNHENTTVVHTGGHWASTRFACHIAGIPGILDGAGCRPAIDTGANVILTDDAKLRFQSLPAGTHKLGIVHEGVKRITRSVAGRACPSIRDYNHVPGAIANFRANPASYHIGAQYLTGQARINYSDSENDNLLGRVATFLRVMYPSSTLTQSPHCARDRMESYSDYNVEFFNALTSYRVTAATTTSIVMNNLIQQAGNCDEEAFNEAAAVFQ